MSDRSTVMRVRLGRMGRGPGAMVHRPETDWLGDPETGRAMLAGRWTVAGQAAAEENADPWSLRVPSDGFAAALHGFDWLDDIAAVGARRAREAARGWTLDWIERFGDGEGPGWGADTVGRRLRQWIVRAPLLMQGAADDAGRRLHLAAGVHAGVLSARWQAAPAGLPRLRALSGLLHAALAYADLQDQRRRWAGALGVEADRLVDDEGGIPSRDPEELAEVLILLAEAEAAARAAGLPEEPRLIRATARIAPALRALRHGDGGLALWHGGGPGAPGRADFALALARARGAGRAEAMGIRRLHRGRTLVLVDVAPPPPTHRAHASTLALEMSCGPDRILVCAGPGGRFGREWRDACRATAAQTTLAIERASSARIPATATAATGPHLFSEGPREVLCETEEDDAGAWVMASHDGYLPSHGLVHRRRLFLSMDGRDVRGEDWLAAEASAGRRAPRPVAGVRFAVRFHLHPDVTAGMDPHGDLVRLRADRSAWELTTSGGRMTLAPSAHFDPAVPTPRATRQIVVSAGVEGYSTRVTWAFRRVD